MLFHWIELQFDCTRTNPFPARSLEKKRREEGGRMRTENKELEYSLDKLREQRAEAEHRLQLVVRELWVPLPSPVTDIRIRN